MKGKPRGPTLMIEDCAAVAFVVAIVTAPAADRRAPTDVFTRAARAPASVLSEAGRADGEGDAARQARVRRG